MLYRIILDDANQVIHQRKKSWWHLKWQDVAKANVPLRDSYDNVAREQYEKSLASSFEDFLITHRKQLLSHPMLIVRQMMAFINKLRSIDPYTKLQTSDTEFFNDVDISCECTRREYHTIIMDFRKEPNTYQITSNLSGQMFTIGYIGNKPICISCYVDNINGHNILWYEPTSTWVNWDMIQEWLKIMNPKAVNKDKDQLGHTLRNPKIEK